MVVCFEDTEHDDFPLGAGKDNVRASSGSFWKYERLPEVRDIPQTRVTYVQQADLKGFIPKFLINAKIVGILMYLSQMRKKFDNSLEIDEVRRSAVVELLKAEAFNGTEALAQFESLYDERPGWERPQRGFGKADSMVLVESATGQAWGRTILKFRASVEEAAAYFWDFGSRANMEASGDIERALEEGEEGETFNKIVRRRQRVGLPISRTFTSALALKRVDSNTIVLLMSPAGDGSNCARMSTKRALGSLLWVRAMGT
ncbi:hypothetical protein TrVE_jg1457 [Triparma verrucosa]|uniref:Uncharacterized protein n=1 Tax=Triparma verrucosa TaxID=1606542 RepID=A0A9W7EN20_9STRA|nr:hypothetical protein TrVE_jg1457 [Triparma verrucosa]